MGPAIQGVPALERCFYRDRSAAITRLLPRACERSAAIARLQPLSSGWRACLLPLGSGVAVANNRPAANARLLVKAGCYRSVAIAWLLMLDCYRPLDCKRKLLSCGFYRPASIIRALSLGWRTCLRPLSPLYARRITLGCPRLELLPEARLVSPRCYRLAIHSTAIARLPTLGC